MRYLIAQQWNNIKGNHAGFPHICKLLQRDYPDKYCLIECDPINVTHHKAVWPFKRLLSFYDSFLYYRRFKQSLFDNCRELFKKINENDEVFLLEYNLKTTPQFELAKYIRKRYKKNKIFAMTHLAPSYLMKSGYGKKKILKWAKPVDMHLTMGSSLSKYLNEVGIPNSRISTGFHATDMEYYHRKKGVTQTDRITIIAIGATQRNFSLLSEIVINTPEVSWILCVGRKTIDPKYYEMDNVRVYGFVEESELRDLMEQANVSINVMDDTIGSNVITNSMSMGLAMIVSDVGSIRDYCNDSFALFCDNNLHSFKKAIKLLEADKNHVFEMQNNAINAAKSLSVENTDKWFDNAILKLNKLQIL